MGARQLDLVTEYTGYAYDQVLGVYYAQARMYDASDRRFMAVDPLKGSVANPQTMAQYTYCLNNPIRFIDPTGLAVSQVDQANLTAQQQKEIEAYQAQYQAAAAKNDLAGMAAAHQGAEDVRANAGYSGGVDGTEYIAMPTAPASPQPSVTDGMSAEESAIFDSAVDLINSMSDEQVLDLVRNTPVITSLFAGNNQANANIARQQLILDIAKIIMFGVGSIPLSTGGNASAQGAQVLSYSNSSDFVTTVVQGPNGSTNISQTSAHNQVTSVNQPSEFGGITVSGTPSEILLLYVYLSTLTDDILAPPMNYNDGQLKVIIINEIDGGLKPNGTELVRQLVYSPYNTNIQIDNFNGEQDVFSPDYDYLRGRDRAVPNDSVSAATNVPTGSNIYINTVTFPSVLVYDASTNTTFTQDMPINIILGHELIHALHYSQGTVTQGYVYYTYYNGSEYVTVNGVSKEELFTTGIDGYRNGTLIERIEAWDWNVKIPIPVPPNSITENALRQESTNPAYRRVQY